MHRWTASAAGGISQRLKPGRAMMRSRAMKLGTATDDLRVGERRDRTGAAGRDLGVRCEPGRDRDEKYDGATGAALQEHPSEGCRDHLVVHTASSPDAGGVDGSAAAVPRVASCRTR